ADVAGGIHFADAEVIGIGDEQIAGAVQGYSPRRKQAGAGGGAAIAGKRAGAVPGKRGDSPAGIYFADAIVSEVSDKEGGGGIHRNCGGFHAGAGGGTAVPRKRAAPVARYRGDVLCRVVHLADTKVAEVGDEQVAARVQRYTHGNI